MAGAALTVDTANDDLLPAWQTVVEVAGTGIAENLSVGALRRRPGRGPTPMQAMAGSSGVHSVVADPDLPAGTPRRVTLREGRCDEHGAANSSTGARSGGRPGGGRLFG
ncbi:hypothetical protein EDF43_10341 [Rathayibacter sp. PhB179]|nr:hypothetical protein EDF49_10341 [Rathayibacter sp. PhB192]TCM29205.1 hypothetical protein EDF43_10341 [Rathayibacter sp. PhB179]